MADAKAASTGPVPCLIDAQTPRDQASRPWHGAPSSARGGARPDRALRIGLDALVRRWPILGPVHTWTEI